MGKPLEKSPFAMVVPVPVAVAKRPVPPVMVYVDVARLVVGVSKHTVPDENAVNVLPSAAVTVPVAVNGTAPFGSEQKPDIWLMMIVPVLVPLPTYVPTAVKLKVRMFVPEPLMWKGRLDPPLSARAGPTPKANAA